MNVPEKNPPNSKMMSAELAISYVLRYGVLICASVLIVGLILAILHPSASQSEFDFTLARQLSVPPYLPSDLLARLIRGDAEGWIATGLICLIALPIFRVALTVVLFAIEGDKIYLAITVIVLAVLLSGIFLGHGL